MVDKNVISADDAEIYSYGLQIMFEKVLGITSMLLISLLSEKLFEGIVFVIVYSALRQYAGGYHAKNFISCYLISCMSMLIFTQTVKVLTLQTLSPILVVLSAPIIFLLSPVEVEDKPLDDDEKSRYGKLARIMVSVEICVFVILYAVKLRQFAFSIAFSMVMLSVFLVIQSVILRRNSNAYKE